MATPVDRWLIATLVVAVAGITACSDDSGGEPGTVTVTTTEAQQAVSGDAILINTRITNARRHMGQVVSESFIGRTPFCHAGSTSGGSEGPTITTTFSCPDGRLTLRYAPTQPSLIQGAPWEAVSGTGIYKGLKGGGSMVARFEGADPNQGREVFTGTVSK